MTDPAAKDKKISISRAIIVEGRDDVDAVSRACDALIIPTHGFGITERTWELMQKAYEEKGIIILTDPDHAGEDIRRRLTERFPGAVQCYMAREDACKGDDIGIENSRPEAIREALTRALELSEAEWRSDTETSASFAGGREITMKDLSDLGLSGSNGAAALRNAVTRELGIGFCNAKAFLARLRRFGISYEELATTIDKLSTDSTAYEEDQRKKTHRK